MRSPLELAATILAALALVSACADERAEPVAGGGGAAASTARSGSSTANGTQDPPDETPVHGYEIVERFPHDTKAYTQGLLVVDGKLYESTGKKGESTVRLVDVETGDVLKKRDVDSDYFAEGLAAVDGLLYQLTWTAGKAFVYDRSNLRFAYDYTYPGEGWGLTTTPEGDLVLSDGTSVLRFLDPKGLEEKRRIQVTDRGRPIVDLNELEWIDGEIWANVWKSDYVARIDPETGKVRSWVDFSGLLGNYRVRSPIEDVLNGIAYDEEAEKLYVTGKRWPYLFHVRVE